MSGGTDNHLMLVDLRPFGVTGKVAQEALDRAGITCNKNAIPNDPEKPFVTSGLAARHGVVSRPRAWAPTQMREIASLIGSVLRAVDDEQVADRRARAGQPALLQVHPVPRSAVRHRCRVAGYAIVARAVALAVRRCC